MKKVFNMFAVVASLCLLGGGIFTSCGDDDDNNDPSLAVTATAISGTVGAAVTTTITATLSNDSFAAALTSGAPAGSYVTISDANSNLTLSSITFAENVAAGANVAKVTASGTAPAAAASGTLTIKVSLPAEAVTSGTKLEKEITVNYTIAAAGSGGAGGTHEVDITTLTPAAVGISVTAQSKAFQAALGTVTKIGDYFTLGPTGSDSKCLWYVRSTIENMNALELGHTSDYKSSKGTKGAYVEFTVTGTGTFTVSGQSTGDGKTSDATLFDAEGNAVAEKDGKTTITGKTIVDLTFENLAAGTYTFSSTGSSSSNLRVTKLKVVEN